MTSWLSKFKGLNYNSTYKFKPQNSRAKTFQGITPPNVLYLRILGTLTSICTAGYVTSNLYYRLLKVYESLYYKVEECRRPLETSAISSPGRQVVLASPGNSHIQCTDVISLTHSNRWTAQTVHRRARDDTYVSEH